MKLVSIPELAEILSLHAATVRCRIKSGEWPCYLFGERSVRIDLDEVRNMLRSPPGKKAPKEKTAVNNRAKSKRSSVSELLANQSGEVMALRGPRKKRR